MRTTMMMTMIAGLLLAPLAFAETTGLETGTDTGDTGDTGDTETTDDGASECGSCNEADEVAWIISPADGASVESPFTVTLGSTYYCYCDDCGCSTASFNEVTIQADGVQVAAGPVGDFELDLEPGVHMLTVSAIDPDYEDVITTSAPITVTVTGNGGNAEDESGGGAIDDVKKGCSIDGSPSGMPLGAGLALLGLLALRRRRS